MKAKFYTAAALALVLAACNESEPENLPADGTVAMSFIADIDGIATRAAGTNFETDDQIGIVPLKSGHLEEAQNNLCYTYGAEGTFTSNPPYYFQDRGEVTFNAYHPWRETKDMQDNVIALDTRANKQNAAARRQNDMLFSSVKTSVSTPQVEFTDENGNAFKHVMTQLTLKFKTGAGISDLEKLTAYTLKSLTMDGSFSTIDGAVTLGAKDKEDLTMEVTGSSKTSLTCDALILLPQRIDNGSQKLDVTYNGVTYSASLTIPEGQLKAGTHYTFEVTVSNTGLTVGEAKIVDWESVTVTGEATM